MKKKQFSLNRKTPALNSITNSKAPFQFKSVPLKSKSQDIQSNNLVLDLFKTNAHIGTSQYEKSNQKDLTYSLYGVRNNISVFNLETTVQSLKLVLKVLENIKKKKGRVLFINTAEKYSTLIKNTAQMTNQSYVNDRWVGGTLTNWKQVSQSISLFQKFSFLFSSFLKQNNIIIPSFEKAKKRYEGLIFGNSLVTPEGISQIVATQQAKPNTIEQNYDYKPDLIILINPEENNIVIEEAKKFQIPIIGFVDSKSKNSLQSKIKHIDYKIPGNTQSISFMYFCLNLFTITLRS